MVDHKFNRKLKRMPKKPGQKIGCLEWQGARLKNYGILRRWKKNFRAHRYAWFLHYGKLPTDFCTHDCDNPPCCEITHLKDQPPYINSAEREWRGRGRNQHGRRLKDRVHAVINGA